MGPIRPHRGFTLIELLVVLAIITIVTAIIITSQSSFNKTLVLANTAYDVALAIRSAETFGLSSRARDTVFDAGYGVHFQKTPNNVFTLFADSLPAPNALNCHGIPPTGASSPNATPGNCVFGGSGSVEWVRDYTLGNSITISNFCAYPYPTADTWSCATTNGSTLSALDIVFARPNPTAFISINGSYVASLTKACLTVTSPQGGFRYILVEKSGMINANALSCP